MSKRDWEEILRRYRTSHKSQVEFCREEGVPLSTLSLELRRSRETGSFSRVGEFAKIELELPGGVKVRVVESQISLILKALQS